MDTNKGAATLRAWMDTRGCSQAAFASLVRVSQQNVSKWLGGRSISLVHAIAVKKATGIPVEDWLVPAERHRKAS